MAHADMYNLKSCQLVDEFEHELKSMNAYKIVYENMIIKGPEFKLYLDRHVVPAPGDWPTWYYMKKIIAQLPQNSPSPLISIIPEQ